MNKDGDEFIILAPEKLDEASQAALCRAFAANPDVWTHLPYEEQHPRFICSPKMWIYENESPFRGTEEPPLRRQTEGMRLRPNTATRGRPQRRPL